MEGRLLSHLELMTIANKDEQYYKEWIDDSIQELAQKCLGMRRWIQYRSTLTVLSRFGYFACTTLSNISTLGEDFCDVTPTTSKDCMRNLLMILLNNQLRMPKEIPKFYGSVLKDIHLITFFLFGDFYEIAKRITNFNYSTQDMNSHQNQPPLILYRTLGCLSAIKLLINVIQYSSEKNESAAIEETNDAVLEVNPASTNDEVDRACICQLCSNTRKDPTSTLCGHIFCWTCIHKWIKDKGECPICRTPTEPSRLVYLINFV